MQTKDNVDLHELQKFESVASRWWDPNSEFAPLHSINPLRLDYIDRAIGLAGKSVLDVGCGGGILAESMSAKDAIVTGIDIGKAAISVAMLHLNESKLNINYQKSTIEDYAINHAQSFDSVTCMELLEHVPDPASIIDACVLCLKPGGHLFLSTLNRNIKSYLFAIIGAEYLLNILPKGTHDYRKFIQPAELDSWCRKSNLQLQEIVGINYNPITQHYSLGKDISVNYIAHFALY